MSSPSSGKKPRNVFGSVGKLFKKSRSKATRGAPGASQVATASLQLAGDEADRSSPIAAVNNNAEEINQSFTPRDATPTPPDAAIPGPAVPDSSEQEDVLDWTDKVKLVGGVAWRCTQTLLKKLPDCIEDNPVKMAAAIMKAVIEIKDEIKGNNDELSRGLRTTEDILWTVAGTVTMCTPDAIKAKIDDFKQRIMDENEELQRLVKRVGSIEGKFDYERCKSDIHNVLTNIGRAANIFKLDIAIMTLDMTSQIRADVRRAALKDLKPSVNADHNTVIEEQGLRRNRCTAGTREDILSIIIKWANDPSSPSVFWLTGQAGAGKTTIAYTIAELFYKGGEATAFGASFFCSRLFSDTNSRNRIIPTIAYHLAKNHPLYADALHVADKFDRVNHEVSLQMDDLIIGPWQQTEQKRGLELPPYLVIVDALDEIINNGGAHFLRILLQAVNKNNLKGLKFFVTSRPHPDIQTLCQSFNSDVTCRLQDVPKDTARADVMKYLKEALPSLADSRELTEVEQRADGLFIYAATVVRYLTPHTTGKYQKEALQDLLNKSLEPEYYSDATAMIDQLYRYIMLDAFKLQKGKYLTRQLRILFTFLCAGERISPSVSANLVPDCDIETATDVLNRLYPVLYLQDGNVIWYHASFPDFVFDKSRSNFSIGNESFEFWCDQDVQHSLLVESCFRVMASPKAGLRFNICNLPSSFMDKEIDNLEDCTKQSICPSLQYACCYWADHLLGHLSTDSITCKLILNFLQLRVLFWFETMSLLGMEYTCQNMLQHAHQWTHECDSNNLDSLNGDLIEAGYFSRIFNSLATPHVYISALASWSPLSRLSQSWKSHFPHLPIVTYTRDDLPFLHTPAGNLIRVMSFSKDGSWIASGSSDGSLRLWDVSSGTEIRKMQGHTKIVWSVTFMNNDTQIVSGSWDKTVRLWDANSGSELQLMVGHTDVVNSVAASSDGVHIVSGSFDGSVRVWDPLTGTELKKMNHDDIVYSVSVSTNNAYIASGSCDKTVRLWNIKTGAEFKRIYSTGYVASVAFSNDGDNIAYGLHDGTVCTWNIASGLQLRMLEGNTAQVRSIAFSSDDKRIVSRTSDHSTWLYNAETGAVLDVQRNYTSSCTSAVIQNGWMLSSPGGDRLMFMRGSPIVTGPPDVTTCHNVVHVDFQHAAMGEDWAQCYKFQPAGAQ